MEISVKLKNYIKFLINKINSYKWNKRVWLCGVNMGEIT